MKKTFIHFVLSFGLIISINSQTTVEFYTSMGNFNALIHNDIQPITGGNFLELVNANFYDGVIFHRVVNNHFIQGGDPTGTGNGGPGYTIVDEFDASLSNTQKTIAMANYGPNTGGSQFFINTVDNTYLDPDYPVFGVVTRGWNVVEAIQNVAVNNNNRPYTPVVMDSIRITSRPQLATLDIDRINFTTKIYPNPISKDSYIEINNYQTIDDMDISLFTMNGKKIANKKTQLLQGVNKINVIDIFEIGKLSTGVYFILLNNGKSSIRKKLIVE